MSQSGRFLALALLLATSHADAQQPTVSYVDCENGSDTAAGTFDSPLRTFREAITRIACDGEDPGCRPPALELHVFPGTCPSEGGIRLPFVARIRGSGMDATTVQDRFVMASEVDCAWECDYVLSNLTFASLGSDGATDAWFEGESLRTTDQSFVIGPSSSRIASLSFERSDLADLRTAQHVSLDLRHSVVRGTASVSGGGYFYDCKLKHLVAGDSTGLFVERSTFHGSGGTAIFHDQTHGGHLTVRNCAFVGYEHHVAESCTAGNDGESNCLADLSRNTFVGSSGSSIHMVMNAESIGLSMRVEGNLFFDAGAAAIAVDMLGGSPPLSLRVGYNNFDPSKGSNKECALRIGDTCYARGRDISLSGLGVGNLDVPSGFAGPGDLRLAANSRLIDAGRNVPPPICPCRCPGPFCDIDLDLDGNRRPVDGDADGVSVNDIGALEYVP